LSPDVHIEPWGPGNLPLLEALNAPAMTEHLGGPESPEKVLDRQRRYELAGSGMFRIVVGDEAVGSVGYWEREWHDEQVYELGWMVVPEFQGRGIAGRAAELVLAIARAERRLRFAHAFPAVDNAPSNAICRKLGFTLRGPHDFEFRGSVMRCNDWRLELF
jgi:RimJ/RimL family protein N-acetyltransferase